MGSGCLQSDPEAGRTEAPVPACPQASEHPLAGQAPRSAGRVVQGVCPVGHAGAGAGAAVAHEVPPEQQQGGEGGRVCVRVGEEPGCHLREGARGLGATV